MWPSSRPSSKVRAGGLPGRMGQGEQDGAQVTSYLCLTHGVTKEVPKPCCWGEMITQRATHPRRLPGGTFSLGDALF